ncbi:bone morphogenetic protein receptor type-2 [Striga asiatica]|uniref:Bone morphogenetic protein receptor type-2 n=1 Tax=Striga asiatica TaxID=4170 RepID=A0A5A7PJI9_STRAF|nr:bone morphogenetic protein receptor type-2 [Striga asiatica]
MAFVLQLQLILQGHIKGIAFATLGLVLSSTSDRTLSQITIVQQSELISIPVGQPMILVLEDLRVIQYATKIPEVKTYATCTSSSYFISVIHPSCLSLST